MLKILTSNLTYSPGKVNVQTHLAFSVSYNMDDFQCCAQSRATSRTPKKTRTINTTPCCINYTVTKIKLGQFKVIRSNKTLTKKSYFKNLKKVLKDNPSQCHNVTKQLKETCSSDHCDHDIVI